MFRSSALRSLSALALVLGLGVALSGPAVAAPQLSDGCARLHGLASQTLATSGDVVLEPAAFAAGEQVLIVGTTDALGVGLDITIGSPGGQGIHRFVAPGQPLRIPINVGGEIGFKLSYGTDEGEDATVTWHVECGVPPTPVVSAPVDSRTFAPGQDVATTFSCPEQTNPVATCVDSHGDGDGTGTLDTDTVGEHTYTVTGTDTAGLVASTSISYTVAKKVQTISFTTTPPNGSDWFFGDFHGWPGYVANAVATSGLPVTYSLAPASVGICRLGSVYDDNPIFGDGVPVEFLAAGTCTISADQAGNDEYVAADRVSQSFVIEKVATYLWAAKAVKGVLGLTPSTFSATLSVPFEWGPGWGMEGYPGQLITFSVAGKQVCSATTNAEGVATCKAPIGLANAISQSSYTATYAGDANYKGATAQGKLG